MGGDGCWPVKVFKGGGIGLLGSPCRAGSEKAGRGSGRVYVDDAGCSGLGDELLSVVIMSESGRGGGADVKDGKAGPGWPGAEDGG